MTTTTYGQFATSLLTASVNVLSDTLKVKLCTSSYVPNRDTHSVITDVNNEVTGTGYTTGGKALTGVTATYSAVTHKTLVGAGNPLWTASTITARFAVIYDSVSSKLICWIDFGVDKVSSGGPFELDFTGGFLAVGS